MVLFVCYGNVCRSPMAAGIARKRFGNRVEVASAGLAADGGPASEEAVLVMGIGYGIDITGHVARTISEYDLGTFDYGVALDLAVYSRLRALKIVPDDRLYGWDIADPLGRGYDAHKEAALKIDRRFGQWMASLGLDS